MKAMIAVPTWKVDEKKSADQIEAERVFQQEPT